MEQAQTIKAHCNTCSGSRNHLIVHCYEEKWEEQIADELPDFTWGEDRYELLKCAGCGHVTFRHTSHFSEHINNEGELIPTVIYYPPATFRPEPDWLFGMGLSGAGEFIVVWLPEFIPRLLKEVYVALHGDCLSLAAMGVRALLETMVIDRIGDKGSFKNNLDAFQKQGYISEQQKVILEATLEVGHASIHRNYSPSREDLRHILDFTEDIIEIVYISQIKAGVLKRKIPSRPKRA
jgi:Zn ribbon nucleic-acid-binding protein